MGRVVLKDLRAFPEEVQDVMGFALDMAQAGLKHPNTKPLTGSAFKGAGVLEVVEDHDGNTYRAVYTVRLEGVVYVLDAFQKKSTRGLQPPKSIWSALRRASKSQRSGTQNGRRAGTLVRAHHRHHHGRGPHHGLHHL
jgi:phage-related protein